MDKIIVQLEEKKVVGLSAPSSFQQESDFETSVIIPTINEYRQQNIPAKITNRIQPNINICAYTQYETNEYGAYQYYIGETVSAFENNPEGLVTLIIPPGKYVKFTTSPGKMPFVIIEAWQTIWKMSEVELGGKRKYGVDFETYDHRAVDPENTVVDIYIGIE